MPFHVCKLLLYYLEWTAVVAAAVVVLLRQGCASGMLPNSLEIYEDLCPSSQSLIRPSRISQAEKVLSRMTWRKPSFSICSFCCGQEQVPQHMLSGLMQSQRWLLINAKRGGENLQWKLLCYVWGEAALQEVREFDVLSWQETSRTLSSLYNKYKIDWFQLKETSGVYLVQLCWK